jgi:hypothetical protein
MLNRTALLGLVLSLACSNFTAAVSEPDAVSEESASEPAPAPEPALRVATNTVGAEPIAAGASGVVYVESPGVGEIAVQIVVPASPRYSEGAPLVVVVPPFFTPKGGYETSPAAEDIGMIRVSLLWPGRADRATGSQSGGEEDYGGPQSTQALRDVIRYATGQVSDTDGLTINQRTAVEVASGNVGVYAFSHPGIAATNVFAHHGAELGGVGWFIGYENPTTEALSAVEAGHWARGGAVENPSYDPDKYSEDGLNIDYSTVGWAVSSDYPEGRPCFGRGQEYVLDRRVPRMWDKRYYSTALLSALRDNGVFTAESWPEDLATPEEAAEVWPYRSSVTKYKLVPGQLPELKVLLMFANKGHVQPSPSMPQVHHAYDGFHTRGGLWVRLNPDQAYVDALSGTSGRYTEHDANTEPTSWKNASSWGFDPKSVPGGRAVFPMASVAEMADRMQAGSWDDDLSGTLFPTSTMSPPDDARPPRGDGARPLRGDGARPPRGDKPPRGDRPTRGDKPPLGDKPPRGKRP